MHNGKTARKNQITKARAERERKRTSGVTLHGPTWLAGTDPSNNLYVPGLGTASDNGALSLSLAVEIALIKGGKAGVDVALLEQVRDALGAGQFVNAEHGGFAFVNTGHGG